MRTSSGTHPTVRAERTLKAWTQAELAQRAGLSRNTVVDIESGKSTTLRSLERIAAALGVSVGQLLPSAPSPKEPHAALPASPTSTADNPTTAAIVALGDELVARSKPKSREQVRAMYLRFAQRQSAHLRSALAGGAR
jgi:transcriptional regulator with XRE-family HTH domain